MNESQELREINERDQERADLDKRADDYSDAILKLDLKNQDKEMKGNIRRWHDQLLKAYREEIYPHDTIYLILIEMAEYI